MTDETVQAGTALDSFANTVEVVVGNSRSAPDREGATLADSAELAGRHVLTAANSRTAAASTAVRFLDTFAPVAAAGRILRDRPPCGPVGTTSSYTRFSASTPMMLSGHCYSPRASRRLRDV